jgi:hypothetical protein
MAMPILTGLVGEQDAEATPPEGGAPEQTVDVLTIDDLTPEELAALEAAANEALAAGLLDGIEIEAGAGAAEPPEAGAEPPEGGEGEPPEGEPPPEGGEGENGELAPGSGDLTSTTEFVEAAEAMVDKCEESVKAIEEAAKELADPKLADPVVDAAWDIYDEAAKVAKDAKKSIKKDDIEAAYTAHETVKAAKDAIDAKLQEVTSGAVALKPPEADPEAPEEDPAANPMGTWASMAAKK